MAGAGYKLFNTGDVLTAAQVNTYLQEQAVMRFANSTARTTALSGVLAEGMMSYLDDTNSVEVYNGSAWVSVGSTGDITGVTAGTGISGGGTSGDVTITNSMATAIDAKGDLIVGTGADTFSRLAVGGTDGHVLKVKASTSTGLEWAAASSGALTLIQRTSFTDVANTGTTFDSVFTSTYKAYQVVIEKLHSVAGATADQIPQMQMYYSGTLQTTNYYGGIVYAVTSPSGTTVSNGSEIRLGSQIGYDVLPNSYVMWFNYVGNTSEKFNMYGMGFQGNTAAGGFFSYGNQTNRTYTGFQLKAASGNITGTVAVYGIASA